GAFVEQAEDNFRAASDASIVGAKPVLLYYSFLNLAKAYILTIGHRPNLDFAKHGLSEKILPGGRELVDAYLPAAPSIANTINVFDEFMQAIVGIGLSSKIDYQMSQLLPQIVTGHRLWCAAAKAAERYVPLERIVPLHDPSRQEVWLSIELSS